MIRLRTYNRGQYRFWADRVPVMHGMATLYTLWRKEGPEWKRLIGGVQSHQLRAFCRAQSINEVAA